MRQAWTESIRKDDITGQITARQVDIRFFEMGNNLKIQYVLVAAMLPKDKLFVLLAFPTSLTQKQNEYVRFGVLPSPS